MWIYIYTLSSHTKRIQITHTHTHRNNHKCAKFFITKKSNSKINRNIHIIIIRVYMCVVRVFTSHCCIHQRTIGFIIVHQICDQRTKQNQNTIRVRWKKKLPPQKTKCITVFLLMHHMHSTHTHTYCTYQFYFFQFHKWTQRNPIMRAISSLPPRIEVQL